MRIFPSNLPKATDAVTQSLAQFAADYPTVYAAMNHSLHGYPSQTMGGGGRSSDVSDPTGDAALMPDQAAADLAQVGVLVATMMAAARGLDQLRHRYTARPSGLRLCQNEHGCPAGNLAGAGRTRCGGCAEYKRRHGHDRSTARERTATGT